VGNNEDDNNPDNDGLVPGARKGQVRPGFLWLQRWPSARRDVRDLALNEPGEFLRNTPFADGKSKSSIGFL
jgi:hypothetical protein